MQPAFAEIQSLTQLWDYSYRHVQPTNTFITYSEQSEGLSYKKINALAHCVAAYFVWKGLKKGDKVGLICENAPMYKAVDLAVSLSNGVNVSINPSMPAKMIRQIIRDFQIKIIYLSGYDFYCKHKSWLDPLAVNDLVILCNVPHLLELSEGDKLVALYCATDVGKNYWRENISALRALKSNIKSDDRATIFINQLSEDDYESIQLTHGEVIHLLSKIWNDFKVAIKQEKINILAIEPYYHLFGRLAGLYLPLITGNPVFLNRTNRTLLQDIERCKPNVLVAERYTLERLFESLKNQFSDDHSFRSRYFDSAFSNAVKVQELKEQKASVPLGLSYKLKMNKRMVLKKAKNDFLASVDFILSQPEAQLKFYRQIFSALNINVLEGLDVSSFEQVHKSKK